MSFGPNYGGFRAFVPTNWYWVVGGTTVNTVFCSATGTYVSTSDATYLQWLGFNSYPEPIASDTALIAHLAEVAPDVVVQDKAGLIAYAHEVSLVHQASGTPNPPSNGGTFTLPTDPTMVAYFSIAFGNAFNDFSDTYSFQAVEGTFFNLSAAQIQAAAKQVCLHVFAVLGTEKNCVASINAGTTTTSAAVDAFFVGITP